MTNKKTTIAISIAIAALVIIAVVGTVAFLKDRGRTEAAGLDSQSVTRDVEQGGDSNNGQSGQNNVSSNDNNQPTENQNTGDNETTVANDDNQGAGTTAGTNGTNGATRGTARGGTATGNGIVTTDNIQDTVITRTEQVEIPERQILEGHYVGWTPMDINADLSAAKITVVPDEFDTVKEGPKVAEQGDEITYKITVTNNSKRDVEGIEVKDTLDTSFLDETTVKFDENSEKGEIKGNTIVWKLDIKDGETTTLVFSVTVKTTAKPGILKNSVITNGVKIDPIDTDVKQKTTVVEGTKTWDDADNQDGKRPESIKVNLLANNKVIKTVTVTEKDGWKYKFADLPVYDANGAEITYSIAEDAVEEYTTTKSGYNLTNTHIPEKTSVSGTKTWTDNNNQDGKRPERITVRLLANGTEVANKTVTANENWAYEFTNLDKYANGAEITYSVSEDAVEGYTTTKSGYDLTNTHTPETTSITVNKSWIDGNGTNRPESITVNLLADGQLCETANITATDNWTHTFVNLPKNKDGKAITYVVTEATVEGYKTEIDGYTIKNTETTSVSGTKTWVDDSATTRPESITVNLLADGNPALDESGNPITKTVTAEDDWKYEFTNLSKYTTNGTEIVYTVTENAVDGYETTYQNDHKDITNTILKTNIEVTKKQYMQNSNQYVEVDNGTIVRADDYIIYLLEATNSGNKPGEVTIKDQKPENADNVEAWIDANENFVKDSEETIVDLAQLNGTGYKLTVPANSKVVIAYKVEVNGYADYEVKNTAEYKNEDEEEFTDADKTCIVKIEDDMEIVPTTSDTEHESVKQRVILVLDYSGSMEGTRISSLRSTASTFIDSFLDLNDENEIMIIKYAKDLITTNVYFTSDKNIAKSQLNTKPDGGTNIDAGLTEANKYITSENAATTSVILMTDGLPSRYIINSNGNCSEMMGDGQTYSRQTEIAANQAIESAGWIKEKGSKLYTIGFGLDEITGNGYDRVPNSEHAKQIIRNIATPSRTLPDGTTKDYYYYAASGAELNNVFESIYTEITTNKDGEHIQESSTDGIITIDEGFIANQDVEIYTGTYIEGVSTTYDVFTWDEFLASEYVTPIYDGETVKEIKFNLGKYMEDEGMNTDENVTIRFVAEGTGGNSNTALGKAFTNRTFSFSPETLSADALTMNVDEKETTTSETINSYEEKSEEAEAKNNEQAAESSEEVEETEADNEEEKADEDITNIEDEENETVQEDTNSEEQADLNNNVE